MIRAEVDRIFHALADATRRDIIARVSCEEQSGSALARHYPVRITAVQRHVAMLERAALVNKERRGRERRGREQLVRVDVSALRRAARLLDAYEQPWRHRARGIEHIPAEDHEGE